MGLQKLFDLNLTIRHNSCVGFEKGIEMENVISRQFLSNFKFKVFSESDYHGFEGVMSPVPLIGEYDNYVAIIDGGRCEVYESLPDFSFDMIDFCDDVNELPL
jgi:hypothetical protein